jgi:dTDP-4-dehydrorhamnose reductase
VSPQRQRILVFGGTGQLGTALGRLLDERGIDHVAPTRTEVDLSRAAFDELLETLSPGAVINASAYNNVNGAELASERATTDQLNIEVPAALAAACARRGIPLAHVSTDYVFDGRNDRPYVEDDPTAPLQYYGCTKLEGERAAVAAYPETLVVRTSTLFGRDRRGGSNYVSAVLGHARANGVLEVVRAPVSSPTHAPDLAAALLELLEVRASGVVHLANRGGCSRLELATEAVRLAGLADRVEIRERPEPTGGAARPAYSVLDTSRYTRLTGKTPHPWSEALGHYIAEL